jgi:hypothetical protein
MVNLSNFIQNVMKHKVNLMLISVVDVVKDDQNNFFLMFRVQWGVLVKKRSNANE